MDGRDPMGSVLGTVTHCMLGTTRFIYYLFVGPIPPQTTSSPLTLSALQSYPGDLRCNRRMRRCTMLGPHVRETERDMRALQEKVLGTEYLRGDLTVRVKSNGKGSPRQRDKSNAHRGAYEPTVPGSG